MSDQRMKWVSKQSYCLQKLEIMVQKHDNSDSFWRQPISSRRNKLQLQTLFVFTYYPQQLIIHVSNVFDRLIEYIAFVCRHTITYVRPPSRKLRSCSILQWYYRCVGSQITVWLRKQINGREPYVHYTGYFLQYSSYWADGWRGRLGHLGEWLNLFTRSWTSRVT